MSEPKFPNRKDMVEPLLKELIARGGSINFKVRGTANDEGKELEIALAKQFGISDADRKYRSRNYHSAGNRKFRNEIPIRARPTSQKGGD